MKIEPEEKPKRGRPFSPRGPLPVALTLKATPEWKAYLEAYAVERRCNAADLIEEAIALMARRDKRAAPPART